MNVSARSGTMCVRTAAAVTAALMGFSGMVLAQDPGAPGPIEQVIVFGRGTQLLGAAEAASEGSVAGADWNASAYVQYYDWSMQSNPTYEYQISQFDKRTTIGGRYDDLLIARADFESMPSRSMPSITTARISSTGTRPASRATTTSSVGLPASTTSTAMCSTAA